MKKTIVRVRSGGREGEKSDGGNGMKTGRTCICSYED